MSKMTRYSEAKSVKVDNWGVFFLQKLQNFFNKTDHCDLTLQFNDNSQLKVHRLVLSACTDYFNHLESVCEMYDDVLIMPMDLQADVIVPIVNFMYTGTLEFQYTMYERLLKTATDMNMTVLLKLLEAHRQTSRISKQPVLLNKQAPRAGVPIARPATTYHPNAPRPAASTVATRSNAALKPRLPVMRQQISPGSGKDTPESGTLVAKYGHAKESKSGPSRFDDTDLSEGLEGHFDDISYESKPLLTAVQVKKEDEPSPFEKLRKGYTNTNVAKRASGGTITSPPAKKPNLEEVKEFTEAARLRSQLNTDDDDSPDYVDDDTHFNDDDDEDYQPPASLKSALAKSQANKQIVVKQETKSPSAMASSMKQITVKDESGNVDHAKIISEVLKKYPHLVKQNKNIKLKIMQKMPSGSNQAAGSGAQAGSSKVEIRTATPLKQDISMVRKATASIRSEQLLKPGSTTASGSAAAAAAVGGGRGGGNNSSKSATTTATATKPNPPKTIDAKTMHALIAKGAENMTGPWLCLRCGINGRPISIPSYKAFRNHLLVKHKERIDARICEHCGWRAETRNPHLVYHWFVEHGIKPPVKFPTCSECDHVAMTNGALKQHVEETHQQERQHCIYCNKVFEKELDLYYHMKEQHRERARSDGVLDFSEDEDEFQEGREESPPAHRPAEGKIKILSNITLPLKANTLPFVIDTAQSQTVSQIGGKGSSEAEALSNVASGIATSLRLVGDTGVVIDDPNYQNEFIEAELASVHGENAATISAENTGVITKLLSEDGTEIQLTPSQREDIISQLQINSANVVMMNEVKFADGSTLQINDGMQIVESAADTDGAVAGGNQNIMLVYSDSATDAGTEDRKTNSTNHEEDAPSEDDENSQNSAALSEKASSSIDKPANEESSVAPEEEEESQESRKTDVSGKEEVGEEDDTAEDVDMLPADTSFESSEPVKPTTKAGTSDNKKVENQKQHKEDAEEERHRSDKLKLISELEGDWSEDTEEQSTASVSTAPAAKAESKQSASDDSTENRSNKKGASTVEKKSVSAVVGTSSSSKKPSTSEKDKKKEDKPSVSNPDKKPVASESPAGKEIDKLLDEWSNEPGSKQDDSDTETELGKKTPKAAGGSIKTEKEKIKQEHEDQNENDDDSKAMETDEVEDAPASKSSDVEKASKTSPSTVDTDDATSAKKSDASSKAATAKKLENVKTEDEEEDQDEEDKEKVSKSKDVNSLLGEWDEDDEL
ncbi:centrosome-associated zinc finger protein CP190 [Anopheles aquasalis]|uniref:centrosome-associated zinc finger protein CP190 n=1 Tax=Anopheles aquasalis TaxID=42839 RepID=UPI00215AECB6|nr:centrosome-associated zinc finger protein CP190 [Anopheles aquasalis]XP_050086293.1 centrosome-associated zinc finger protein CP190 [Anopheles aquasalis]XP_050086294.1 centrosome-associated zinc finger protein CP190 [Anopheles aquasalis]